MKRKAHDDLKTFHVFQGIKEPELKHLFQKTQRMFQRINEKVKFIYINTEQIEKKCWKPKDLIDWLLEGDYHIILSHIHQGLKHWNVCDIRVQLSRLYNHPGFPNGIQLVCPVFTQDKYLYIQHLPEFTNPTLQLKLPYSLNKVLDKKIINFLNQHNSHSGWVVKLPYTTMGKAIKFCFNRRAIDKALNYFSDKFGATIPYAMVQVMMKNKREYRVVALKGKVAFLATIPGYPNYGKEFSKPPHLELFRFAQSALDAFKARCAGALTDCIFRVDIFQNNSNQFVVNEFESLEASRNTEVFDDTTYASECIKTYFFNVFKTLTN